MLKQTRTQVRLLIAASCLAALNIGPRLTAWADYDPQLTPRRAPEGFGHFDRTDELKIIGVVDRIEQADVGPVIWMLAQTVQHTGLRRQPGDFAPGVGQLWRIEGAGVAKFKDFDKLVRGSKVAVGGYNANDKSCVEYCSLSARSVAPR